MKNLEIARKFLPKLYLPPPFSDLVALTVSRSPRLHSDAQSSPSLLTMPFTVAESEKSELAVVFAALILHDDKAAVSGDNIAKILAAAKSTYAPLFVDCLHV
jgi:hypothetical protein